MSYNIDDRLICIKAKRDLDHPNAEPFYVGHVYVITHIHNTNLYNFRKIGNSRTWHQGSVDECFIKYSDVTELLYAKV